jgi:beta-glucosidase
LKATPRLLDKPQRAITLLKNEGNILPLSPKIHKKIAVVGSDNALNVYGGRGSGLVKGYDHINFMAGLKQVYGDDVFRVVEGHDEQIKICRCRACVPREGREEGRDVPYYMPR